MQSSRNISDPVAASKLPLWLVKILHFEFWPMWLFYIPAYWKWLYHAIRSRNLLYFTAANPGIELGGFFGESKSGIMHQLPQQYLPITIHFESGTDCSAAELQREQSNLLYPLVGKPDVGERGNGVAIITDKQALENWIATQHGKFMLQELVTYPVELGILYYKIPFQNKSGITSIVMKEFLSVCGDGKTSVAGLVSQNLRGKMQLQRLQKDYPAKLKQIPKLGEQLVIESVGNHCKGTLFLNGNHLINEQLVKVFDKITREMDQFFFGRFDLKVASLEDLYNGSNIKIMELNGTTSEPAHIYDPAMKLLDAYKDVFKNMDIVAEIAILNIKSGIKTTPVKEFSKTVFHHFTKSQW